MRPARDRKVRVGCYVDPVTPLWAPADLARVWMSLHHLTGGRAIFGIGSGEEENLVPYGLSPAPRVRRLDDVVTAVRAAWASEGEPLTHRGPFHAWHDAVFALPSRKGSAPPIWIGAQGPKACEVAGRSVLDDPVPVA